MIHFSKIFFLMAILFSFTCIAQDHPSYDPSAKKLSKKEAYTELIVSTASIASGLYLSNTYRTFDNPLINELLPLIGVMSGAFIAHTSIPLAQKCMRHFKRLKSNNEF